MDMRPLQIQIPAHSHMALRVFAIQNATTVTKLVLQAIDEKYPSLRVFESKPQSVISNPLSR